MDDDDDGIFCMTFRDFCTHFKEATVCKMRVVEGEESNWHEVRRLLPIARPTAPHPTFRALRLRVVGDEPAWFEALFFQPGKRDGGDADFFGCLSQRKILPMSFRYI